MIKMTESRETCLNPKSFSWGRRFLGSAEKLLKERRFGCRKSSRPTNVSSAGWKLT